MIVVMTGASGFVGSHLTRRLTQAGHEVRPVSRRPGAPFDWSDPSLRRALEGAGAAVHLAGENLAARRWSSRQKDELVASRVETGRRLARLAVEAGVGCVVCASAVGWYGESETEELDEASPRGQGFLADLCRDWEQSIEDAVEAGVRSAWVRTGLVLGEGGPLKKMLPPFRLGLGGSLGHGRQWVPWIHLDDLCALYQRLIEDPGLRGAYNGTAPNPVRMRELATTLGRVLRRPTVFPVPAPVLRIVLGEMAEVLLTGQKVLPTRALEAGFTFGYPQLEGALREILGRPARAAATAH